jgi:hypothetical protein
MTPDRWQTEVLQTRKAQILLLCSRQVGKTLVASALALRTALLEAPALVLVLTLRSGSPVEFMRRIKERPARPQNRFAIERKRYRPGRADQPRGRCRAGEEMDKMRIRC